MVSWFVRILLHNENTIAIKNIDQRIEDSRSTVIDKLVLTFLFIGLAFVLYWRCLGYDFVLDDTIVITSNDFTQKGFSGLWDIFSKDSFYGYFGESKALVQGGRYRPLSIMSFAVEHQFFGSNSWVSHFGNILLYGLTVFVIFLMLKRLVLDTSKHNQILLSIPFVIAILYLVHPLHTEAVANIKGRDEIMSMLFSALALLYGLKYADEGKKSNLMIMGLVYYLGLLSKENTLTFLGIIPTALYIFRPKIHLRARTVFMTLGIITVGYLLQRYLVLGYLVSGASSTDLLNNPFVEMDLGEKYSTILYTLLLYLKLLVYPIPLTHDYYPYHIPIMEPRNWQVALSLGLYISMFIFAIRSYRKYRLLSFGILFFIMALSIVSNLIFNLGTFMNERFVFVASLGGMIALVATVRLLIKQGGITTPKLTSALFVPLILFFSFVTWQRIPVWKNAMSLNRAGVAISPNSARANSFMSTALFNQYKEETNRERRIELLKEGLPYAEKAVEIHSSYYNGQLMKTGISAELYKLNNNTSELLNAFHEVIIIRPDIQFIQEFLDYVDGRSDIIEMTQFYASVGESLRDASKVQNHRRWAQYYIQRGLNLDANNPTLLKLKSNIVAQ